MKERFAVKRDGKVSVREVQDYFMEESVFSYGVPGTVFYGMIHSEARMGYLTGIISG